MSTGVLVIEDDGAVRRRIVAQLEASGAFHVSGEAGSVAEARVLVERAPAALGIFDLRLPDGEVTELIPRAVARGIAVLVLTIWDDDASLIRALDAGAGGYILKDDAAGAERLAEALTALAGGGAPISPAMARKLLDAVRSPPTPDPATEPLTSRESEILELFAKGATYEEVASAIGLSVNTVRHHVRKLYRKLDVVTKAEAVSRVPGRR